MYRVTIYNGTTSTVIHEPSTDPDDAHLYECSLVQGSSGEIDSLSFTITPNNPGYEKLNSYSTFIEVVDLRSKGEAAIFSGRVLSVSPQMEESGLVYKNIVCEDRLGYLCDSIQPYTTMNTYTVREFLELLLNNHNAQVEDYKKMYVGTVSFNTSSGNVTKSLNYQTTWEAITGKLLELGGEIQLYTLNGLLYIDYVTELGTMGDQTIEIAKNMRSLEQDKSPTDIITRLIPLGDYLDEQTGESDDRERLTIASVNGGRTYIDDDDAIAAYGIIAGTVIWEDVTLASNLLEKGQQWLKDQSVNETVSLSAYDLYAAGIDPDVIERYNYYLTYNPLIGVNKWYRVAQKTINVIDPTDVSFTMGDQSTSLSSTVKRTGQDAADAAAAINANLSKTVATLIAGNAIIQYLQAEVAEIETLYVTKEYVNELVAADIQATIIEAGLLTADSAVITDLTAFAANIYTLLGGEGAFGELETAHLTADNVVIDEAVIVNAIAGTILADMIEADYIDTDLISIHSEDGTLWIDGSTMWIKDADGNYRIQIGLDGYGDYNLALWDADGNCMWNASGATEYGINDGAIRDIAVADDANISGYKLNIEEICSIINSSGQYEIDASSVTISGTTLDAWYATITEEIEGLEGLSFEGLISIEPWFALSSSDTEPPDAGEPSAILGTFVCGTMPCGHRGATDWVNYDIQTEEGMYKWVKWKGTYADGHTEWSIPYCLTDGYLRTTTGVLQTELEVVQGWISERVWYTEIMDDVDKLIETDVWSELNIWLNGIELEVGEMQSTFTEQYESLVVQVAGIYLDVNSITSRVESTEQQIGNLEYQIENLDLEGVSYFETYFCLWDSSIDAPPDSVGSAICGQCVCGEAICGLMVETTTKRFSQTFDGTGMETIIFTIDVSNEGLSPSGIVSCTLTYGRYYSITSYTLDGNKAVIEVSNLNYPNKSYEDTVIVVVEYSGASPWTLTEPQAGYGEYLWVRHLLYYEDGHTEWTTPYCLTEEYIRTQMSEIVQTTTSITERVTSVETWLGDGYSSSLSLNTLIEQYVDEGKAEIIIEVSRDYALKTDLDDVVEYTDAQIKVVADETSASIDIVTKALESAEDGWSASIAEIYTYVDKEVASISLSVSGTLGGRASITIQAGGGTSTDYIDLSLVREAFATEDSSVTITAGLIQFGSGTLTIDSSQFTLDEAGNATFSGNLTAPHGNIGGFDIGDTALYAGYATDFGAGRENSVYLGTDGIMLGTAFSVNKNGYLSASSGLIGCLKMESNYLYTWYHDSFDSTGQGIYIGYSEGLSLGANFSVTNTGDMKARSGEIGGFTIGSSYITSGPASIYDQTKGIYIGTDGIECVSGSQDAYFQFQDGRIYLGYDSEEAGYISGYGYIIGTDLRCVRMSMDNALFIFSPRMMVLDQYFAPGTSVSDAYEGATGSITVVTSVSSNGGYTTKTLYFCNGIMYTEL